MRLAIYYAPAAADPLWAAASRWLGRDAETGAAVAQPLVPDIAALTASPRLYGFHATLKPPMRLATAYHQLIEDAAGLARSMAPFNLPPLEVGDIKGFLALREAVPSPALHALADACVVGLDRHRAPAEASELARRRAGALPPEQEAMLVRWGYPHVLQTWFFHMTLTRRLSPEEAARTRPAAVAHFAEALRLSRRVDALTVFTQIADGAPFLVAERLAFGARGPG